MFGGIAPFLIRQAPGITRPTRGRFLRDDGAWQGIGDNTNLLVNSGYFSFPIGSGRSILNNAYGPANWFVQTDGSSGIQLVNSGGSWNGNSIPAVEALQATSGTFGVMLGQVVEAAGPSGLNSQVIAATGPRPVWWSFLAAVTSGGGPTAINACILYGTGPADSSNFRNNVATFASGVLNSFGPSVAQAGPIQTFRLPATTQQLQQCIVQGWIPANTTNIIVLSWMNSCPFNTGYYQANNWLGVTYPPPVWTPHPADVTLIERYAIPLVYPPTSAYQSYDGYCDNSGVIVFAIPHRLRKDPTLIIPVAPTWAASSPTAGQNVIAADSPTNGGFLTITGSLTLSVAAQGSNARIILTPGTSFAGGFTAGAVVQVRIGSGVNCALRSEI